MACTEFIAVTVAARADRRWLAIATAIGWLVFLPLLAFVNDVAPFASGGDDQNYFFLATTPFHSVLEAADLTAFTAGAEQPGYPVLLSVVWQATGADLLGLKVVNLSCFLVLVALWYRVGFELDGQRLARGFAIAGMLMTPLWFYWFALLKDIVIALLQSAFLLSLVFLWRGRRLVAWLLAAVSTLAILPFRTALVALNIVLFAGASLLVLLLHRKQARPFSAVVIGVAFVLVTFTIASNPEIMASLGITNEQRVLGEGISEMTANAAEQSLMNRTLFPVLYLVIETSGLTPAAWRGLNLEALRGILAVPWILFGVPYFLVGVFSLVRGRHGADPTVTIQPGRLAQALSTPWTVVLLFLSGYVAISWIVGDTTRWRVPDLPVFSAIAAYGFLSVTSAIRIRLSVLWLIGGGVAAAAFRVLQG